MKRKIELTILIMLVIIGLNLGGVQASYQSSADVSPVKSSFGTWTNKKTGIKGMSTASGAIGATDAINVHLQKNTEYGAMLIFAVSDYGKQGNGTSGSDWISSSDYGLATTTGNVSGIYQIGTAYEDVAAGDASSEALAYYLYIVDSRERDSYSATKKSYIAGDAMNIYKWQGGDAIGWLMTNNADTRYYRFSRKGFSYERECTYSTSNSKYDYTTNYARACIINGVS